MPDIRVEPIPCLKDNYAWAVVLEATREVVLVDVPEAPPILRYLSAQGLELRAILCTHHHFDHVGGNLEALAHFPGIPVAGHESDRGRIPGQTLFLRHGQSAEIGPIRAEIFHIPGHTSGAIAYRIEDALFTGDTLFWAGCGRLFEGTPAQMYHSLNEVLGQVPGEAQVYCGHEYTAANLTFALSLDPENEALKVRQAEASRRRQLGAPTGPTSLGLERQTNPFLACSQLEWRQKLWARLQGNDPGAEETFALIRRMKDEFRG